jgi:hypothetical protein
MAEESKRRRKRKAFIIDNEELSYCGSSLLQRFAWQLREALLAL